VSQKSTDAVQSRGDVKLKSTVVDFVSKKQSHQVLHKGLSKLLSIFPNASLCIVVATLTLQLIKNLTWKGFKEDYSPIYGAWHAKAIANTTSRINAKYDTFKKYKMVLLKNLSQGLEVANVLLTYYKFVHLDYFFPFL